jgi:hypothetical protein
MWNGAAASSFKEETQANWSKTDALAANLETLARMLHDAAAAIRAEIERRRRAREAREAAARAAAARRRAAQAASS